MEKIFNFSVNQFDFIVQNVIDIFQELSDELNELNESIKYLRYNKYQKRLRQNTNFE